MVLFVSFSIYLFIYLFLSVYTRNKSCEKQLFRQGPGCPGPHQVECELAVRPCVQSMLFTILGYIRSSTDSRSREVILPLFSDLMGHI